MYVDPPHGTMATLYGNEMALQAIKANTATSAKARLPSYRAGAILALITWSQREDPHWFGGRMPDRPQLVEFVQVAVAGETPRYRHFAGSHWAENNESSNRAGQRTAYILGLPPAQLP